MELTKKQIKEKIRKLYVKRNEAYDILLDCDLELDKLLIKLLDKYENRP